MCVWKKCIREFDRALLHINDTMDRNQPVEVMLRAIKEVQMFLLVHPKASQELANTNIISYVIIKLNKTGGIYTKALNCWNTKALIDRKTWAKFFQNMIAEFEIIIASGAGPILDQ